MNLRAVTLTTVLALLVSAPAFAQSTGADEEADRTDATARGDVVDYSVWAELLEEYVDDGMIDYRRWAADDEDQKRLDNFVEAVGEADARGHSREAVLAFLINAYNALVIDEVLKRWPVDNVFREEGFFDGTEHRVLQSSTTLDELEKEYVRERYGEPRVNFVLNCAARSCPPLRSEPLTEQNLEEALEEATRDYIPEATRLRDDGDVETSKLFEWYAGEFEEAAGSVGAYLAEYVEDDAVRSALGDDETDVVFRDYDWRINAAER